MDPEFYVNFLNSRMSNAKFASGRKFINCRCPMCGDSVNPKSAHLYIRIPWDNNSVSWYYCHKCISSGVMTYRTLIEWDIFDQEIANQLTELNSRCLNGPRQSRYFNRTIYNITNTYTTIDDKSEYKRQYICNRLGYDLSYKELKDLKIVLNLKDLLNENRVDKITRDISIVNELNREFIGFLSIDNAFLNMRRTCEEGIVYKSIDKRYVNYKIYDKDDTTQRFYTIPTIVDLNTTGRIPFHIAEGPFDILSIYLNLRNKSNGIYTSVTGSNYISIILFFLIDLRLPNIELHIYPDNDKFGSDDKMYKLISKLPDPTIPVYIHRNIYDGQKDFGVPKNMINESIMRFR